MENSTFDLVRQILRSPAFLVQTTERKIITLDEIVATGEITREEVNRLINQELNGENVQQQINPSEDKRLVQLLNGLDYNTFLTVVMSGKIRGEKLITLCSSSRKLNEYCNKSFQLRNAKGDVVGEPQEQHLFRLLLNEIGVRPYLGITPRQLYIGKVVGGKVWSFGGDNKYHQLGHDSYKGKPVKMNYELQRQNVPTVIPEMKNIIQASVGSDHSLCLDSQGRVWTFGSNVFNQTGISLASQSATLPTLNPYLRNIVQVSAGDSFSLCLDNQGQVWGFGSNRQGNLGVTLNNHMFETAIPIVNPNLKNIVQISCGATHSLCLDRQGHVWTFGANDYGQLGLGDTNGRHTPTLIPGLNNIVQVNCCGYHSLCIDNQGQVWAFGRNTEGQSGLGHNNNTSIPTMIPNLSAIVEVSSGIMHSLCLNNQGKVLAFGRGISGELGIGHEKYVNIRGTNIPVEVLHLRNIVQIAAGGNHSICLDNQGKVWVFGDNNKGELGVDPTTFQLIDFPYLNPNLNKIIYIATGRNHTLCIGL